MKLTIRGIESLTNKLNKMVVINPTAGLLKGALRVERTAKELCPVDTGMLRNSITHDIRDNYAVVGTSIDYAPYVEYGTSEQPAQPYLNPALILNRQDIINDIVEDIQKQLRGL